MVMAAFVLSRILGLVRVSLLASAFGAGPDLDAFNAALRVTDTLYTLVAGGALGSAFIPTFASYLARGERRAAWRVGSAIVNLVFLTTVVASVLAAIIAPWLVEYALAPGLELELQRLTVQLLRWMLASTVIFGVSGLLMGILNANDHFLLPALAPSMYNLGIISGVALGARTWGIYAAAIGTVGGALFHLLVQLPALRRLDWAYSPILGLRLEGVREVGRLMGPRILGMAVTQLNFWINTNLGSRIPVAGVISALNFGWLLMLLPQGIFAQAIATVLFPSFSAQAARQEQDSLRETLLSALSLVLYLTVPATIGMILLRRPIVEMFFMRGEFDAQDVAMAAWALAWFAVGLIAHSELEIVTRAFYALHDTVTPVWVGGGAMALNAGLSLLLRWLFEWVGVRGIGRLGSAAVGYQAWMPLGGLALANSVATIVETLALSWLLRRRLGGWDGHHFTSSAWRTVLSGAGMAVVVLLLQRYLPTRGAWALGIGGVTVGASAYLALSMLLRVPEVALVRDTVRRRWSR
jgi:putative peptidoglycan lipid II flippase